MHNFLLILTVYLATGMLGTVKYRYFFSYSFGLGTAASGIAMLLGFSADFTPLGTALLALLTVYGAGLALTQLISDLADKKAGKPDTSAPRQEAKPLVLILTWLATALFGCAAVSPLAFMFSGGGTPGFFSFIGLVLMAAGVVIIGISRAQSLIDARRNAGAPIRGGLYSFSRCPNIFGEIVMWLGVFVAGFSGFGGALRFAVGLIGFAAVLFVCLCTAKDVELEQDRSFGGDPDYADRIEEVPLLVPFSRMYSMKKFGFPLLERIRDLGD